MYRAIVILISVFALLIPAFPGVTAEAALADDTESTQTMSAGSGGYVPIAPSQIGRLSGFDGQAEVAVGGMAGIPDEGVGAVVLNLAVTDATGASTITVWPTGSARSEWPDLTVDASRDWTTMVIAELGTDGRVSVESAGAEIDLAVDALGWFPDDADLTPVEPDRLFDTADLSGRTWLRPDETVRVAVLGEGEVPADGVDAVVMRVTATSATRASSITVRPAGDQQPRHRTLVAEPGHVQSNLAIVEPGEDGAVSIHNRTGRTGLTMEVVAWVAEDSSYHPVGRATLLDTRSDYGAHLGAGETVEIRVLGAAGVPDPTVDGTEAGLPFAAVVNLTAYSSEGPTAVSLWPTGEAESQTWNVAAPLRSEATISLAIAELGDDGRISVTNHGAATHLRIEITGWMAMPAIAAELEVPDSTVPLEPEAIESVDDDGTVVLHPDAEQRQRGDHVIVGITPDTPDGYLGVVESVDTAPDGTQTLETRRAYLDEAFSEGDLNIDISQLDLEVVSVGLTELPEGRIELNARAETPDGVLVDITMQGQGDADTCTIEDGVEVYLDPIFDVQLGVKWGGFLGLIPKKVTALATLGAEAGVSLSEASVSCGWEFDIYRYDLVFWVGIIPVYLQFDFDFVGEVVVELSGLDLYAKATATVTFGVWENQWVKPFGALLFDATTFDEALLQARDLNASAIADVWLQLEIKLYGVVGPVAGIGPFLETFLTTDPGLPWWGLDAGVAGKVGFTIDLWFVDLSWEYAAELPIAPLLVPMCSTYGPGPPGPGYEGICHTPVPDARANGDSDGRLLAERFRLMSSGRPLAQLAITPLALPAGFVGQPYPEQTIEVTGLFSETAVLHVDEGEIPGLTLDPESGVLSGTPTATGTYEMTVQAWYGPVDPEDEEPPFGPYPPPEIVLEVIIDGPCDINVTDPGDDGNVGQLRPAIDGVCDGGTINVPPDMTVELALGELVIPEGKTITVDGDSGAVVVADGTTRAFRLDDTSNLTLSGLGVTGGSADNGGGLLVELDASLTLQSGTTVYGNQASFSGGGIHTDGGSVTLTGNATVAGNEAVNGGGVASSQGTITLDDSAVVHDNTGYLGGGVNTSSGTVVLNGDSAVVGNHGEFGGGVFMFGSDAVTLNDTSRIDGNDSGGYGGGVAFNTDGGTLTLNDGANISFNRSDFMDGGGVYLDQGGAFVMNDSSFMTGNTTDESGGAIATSAGADQATITLNGTSEITENAAGEFGLGGGIYVSGASVLLNADSAVSGNTTGSGGGIYATDGTVALTDRAEVRGNEAINGGGVFVQGGTLSLQQESRVVANTGYLGGGITTESGAVVTLGDDAEVAGNRGEWGGGLFLFSTDFVTLNDRSTIAGNEAGGYGGGVAISSEGTVTLNGESSISNNQSLFLDGGGVFLWGGHLVLTGQASMLGNTTPEYGGAVAIVANGDTVTVTLSGASFITGNTAGINGGGIYQPAGTVMLLDDGAVFGNAPDDIYP